MIQHRHIMKSPEGNIPLSEGDKKVAEYVTRIKNGESKDSISKGLPESFRFGVEKRLAESAEDKQKTELKTLEVPPQYRKPNSEAQLQEEESTERKKAQSRLDDQIKIDKLREQLGIAKPRESTDNPEKEVPVSGPEELPTLSIEERKKLHGWMASYELAKIAKQQGVDLSKISREDYVNFAIKNSLAIDDDQLRVAPWQRMGTSVEEIVLANR